MALDLEKINILKQKVAHAKDFREPYNYFFDHFVKNDPFREISEKIQYPELEKGVENIAQTLLQKPYETAKNFLITSVTKQNFYHGGFFIESKIGNFMFFKEPNIGIVALVSIDPNNSDVLFGRFALVKAISSPTTPSFN